jgi:hypothetical protein
METQWKSKQLYEHPAKHQRGVCGIIELSKAGVYVLKVGGCRMSCPQEWAAKIHKTEQDEVTYGRPSVGPEMLPALKVPEELRAALKAKAAELGISVPDARREAYRLFTMSERESPRL